MASDLNGTLKEFLKPTPLKYKDSYIKRLKKGEIISFAKVSSDKNSQDLKTVVFTLHPKTCEFVLKKLSRYEKFKDYISFVKRSTYNDQKNFLYFYMDHTLMPFPMSLGFNIKRITKPGDYSFVFKSGMLKDLLGVIVVRDIKKQCFLSSRVSWKGVKTKIPDLVFEIMAQTLAEKALAKLKRISVIN